MAIVHAANVFCRISGLGTPLDKDGHYHFHQSALELLGVTGEALLERRPEWFKLYANAADLLQIVPA